MLSIFISDSDTVITNQLVNLFFSLFSMLTSYLKTFSTLPLMIDGNDHEVVSWGITRYLLKARNAEPAQNSSLTLAAERTHRKDPLDDFNYYKGGWNIREKHYFSVSLEMPS